MKNKKIIIIQGGFPSLSATFILDQMTGLIDRGFEIENWALSTPETLFKHNDVTKYNLLKKTKWLRLPDGICNYYPRLWFDEFVKINEIDLKNIGMFHVHYGSIFHALQPFFQYIDIYTVVSFHGHDATRYIQRKGADCYQFLFERADLITTPSRVMKKNLMRYGCREHKIVVHRCGVKMKDFCPKKKKANASPTIFLTVGRLVEKKGIDDSVRAFSRMCQRVESEYRIIGDGEKRAELEALVQQLGIADKVIFLGGQNKKRVISEMRSADIFVLTSKTAGDGDEEGLPVSLIEAQAIGLPVVSTHHAGIPELVRHEDTGFLVRENDIVAIAEYMERLAKDPGLRSAMSLRASQRVEKEFDIEKLNDRLQTIITRAVKKPRSKGDSALIAMIEAKKKSWGLLHEALDSKGWGVKKGDYESLVELVVPHDKKRSPDISVIVISWRLHPDTIKNFKILKKQRDQNFELIFVDNGGKEGEFKKLTKYVDTYVRLNANVGAYKARNIGAVFAQSPILIFLEDDGIPENNFIEAHFRQHKQFDIVSCRGVSLPKTDNPLNALAGHYYRGDTPFPSYADLEGNVSYRADIFYAVGGWDDQLVFGGGGIELARRLIDFEPDMRKQIYSPEPIIYHDYAVHYEHLQVKWQKQKQSMTYITARHPDYTAFLRSWKIYHGCSDTLIRRRRGAPPLRPKKYSAKEMDHKTSDDFLVLFESGRLNEAEAVARAICKRDKNSAKLLYNIASELKEKGDHKKARALFCEILDVAYATDRLILGLSHFKLGEIDHAAGKSRSASEQFRKSLAYYPTHVKAREMLRTNDSSKK